MDFLNPTHKIPKPIQITICEPKERFDKKIASLIELICEMNIPYTQINSPVWVNFIETLNPNFQLPSQMKLRELICSYSDFLSEKSLIDLRNKITGIAIDGAAFLHKHLYAIIFINSSIVRLYKVVQVDDQSADTIAKELHKCYLDCNKFNIKISGIVSDNAPNLVCAISGNHPFNLPSLLGESVRRVACAAHTVQLVIADVVKDNPDFKSFTESLLSLVLWIGNREESFKSFCPCKLPKYICTRWNTLCEVLSFVLENKKEIETFIDAKSNEEIDIYKKEKDKAEKKLSKGKNVKMPLEPAAPPLAVIPPIWFEMLQPLYIIKTFTETVEGDLRMQYHVYKAYKEAINQLSLIEDSDVATYFKTYLETRFSSTLDLRISHLSYVFTEEGLIDYRNDESSDKQELLDIFYEFTCDALSKEVVDNNFLVASFEHYLDNIQRNQKRSSIKYWEYMEKFSFIEAELNDGKPISFKLLSKIALIFISLPATEAVAERCFSALRRLINDYNKSIGIDLFIAMSNVKMSTRYSRKYPI